ncbi:hypothetical protein Pmani_025368, partial [Petrolisthes manimaculis]
CEQRPDKCCDPPERPWPPQAPPPPSRSTNKHSMSSLQTPPPHRATNQHPLPPLQAPPPPRNTSPPVQAPPQLPIWTNWYFWVMVAAVVVACLLGCGYWRKRKIYESSASQTLTHPHHHHHHPFSTPTPSDDTPTYGPPLPFLPPAPYPAPPPYSEAARPSFDPQEHHLFDAVLAGRSVYDYYDRRHPNAYYDRYFLPDDTSSTSETTSLLSYRLHRSCSAHLPSHLPTRHHPMRKCDMLAPPPYSEVAAKPELYPVVMMRGGGIPDVHSLKSMGDSSSHYHHLPPHCHHYIYRSGSVSTPEGSQSSSYTCSAVHHSDCRGGRVSSPGCVLVMASPASSVGPHTSDVSSLPPTSPPSPPAPTSPTLPASPAAQELRDVLQKISQLPGTASSPPPPPALTPGPSPLPTHFCSPIHAPYTLRARARRPLGASWSLEVSGPSRPRSLPLNTTPPASPPCLHDPPSPLLTTSASTPNLASNWPSPPSRALLVASLVDEGARVIHQPTHNQLSPGEGDGEWSRGVGEHRFRWMARERTIDRV